MSNKVKKILIISAIVVIAVITLLIITFFWQEGKKKSELTPEPELTSPEEMAAANKKTIDQAINEKNPSLCDKIEIKTAQFTCKVFASAEKKDVSFCNQNLKDYENKIVSIDKNMLELSPNDFCWFMTSIRLGENYCEKMESDQKNIICSYISERLK